MPPAKARRSTAAESTEPVEPRQQRRRTLVYVVILGAAAVCRIYASLDDFWLDEIWSWGIAENCRSWQQVFRDDPDHTHPILSARVDNNHFLNTGILYLLGPDRHWYVYRFPAVVAGIGAVVLAGLFAAPQGFIGCATTLALTGGSYLLIHYSSEARGYAYVQFFAIASFLLMRHTLNRRRWWSDLLFGASAALGFLSHLTFLYCYLAVVVWSVWQDVRANTSWRTMMTTAFRCHVLPVGLLSWLYVVNLREMVVGGGTRADAASVALQAMSLVVGGPESGKWVPMAATVALVLFVVCLAALWRSGSTLWLFYCVSVVVGPVLLLLAALPEVVYPRYYLVAALCVLLAWGDGLSRMYRCGRLGRAAYWLLLAVFLAANGFHTARLVLVGRGGYLETVRFIHEHTRAPEVSLGSDHEFRNFMIVHFYEQFLREPKPMRYVTEQNWPEAGPEWMLLHNQQREFRPPPTFTDFRGNRYTLEHSTRFAELSGWHWAVYHNERSTP